MIDFNFENSEEPKSGSLLIAEPFLEDGYFSRAVVYLCDHNAEGSFGFVLNKFISMGITDLIDQFPEVSTRISVGGPVDTSNLYFIHSMGEHLDNSSEIRNGICIGGSFDQLKSIIELDPSRIHDVRFFVGYAGWESGQLEEELKEKSWIVINDVKPEVILDVTRSNLWKSQMNNMGGKFKIMSTFPENPSDN